MSCQNGQDNSVNWTIRVDDHDLMTVIMVVILVMAMIKIMISTEL